MSSINLSTDAVEALHKKPRPFWYIAVLSGFEKGPERTPFYVQPIECGNALVPKGQFSVEFYAVFFCPSFGSKRLSGTAVAPGLLGCAEARVTVRFGLTPSCHSGLV